MHDWLIIKLFMSCSDVFACFLINTINSLWMKHDFREMFDTFPVDSLGDGIVYYIV